jgi:hypothetical protein
LQSVHASFAASVVEAEAEPVQAIEQAKSCEIHLGEQGDGLGRDGWEDPVLDYRAMREPGSSPAIYSRRRSLLILCTENPVEVPARIK